MQDRFQAVTAARTAHCSQTDLGLFYKSFNMRGVVHHHNTVFAWVFYLRCQIRVQTPNQTVLLLVLTYNWHVCSKVGLSSINPDQDTVSSYKKQHHANLDCFGGDSIDRMSATHKGYVTQGMCHTGVANEVQLSQNASSKGASTARCCTQQQTAEANGLQ